MCAIPSEHKRCWVIGCREPVVLQRDSWRRLPGRRRPYKVTIYSCAAHEQVPLAGGKTETLAWQWLLFAA
jgi:hypothetical protein